MMKQAKRWGADTRRTKRQILVLFLKSDDCGPTGTDVGGFQGAHREWMRIGKGWWFTWAEMVLILGDLFTESTGNPLRERGSYSILTPCTPLLRTRFLLPYRIARENSVTALSSSHISQSMAIGHLNAQFAVLIGSPLDLFYTQSSQFIILLDFFRPSTNILQHK